MKKYPVLLFTLLLCACCHAQRIGNNYAVFFYVTNFQPGWAELPETAIEANALQTELSTNYNFICEAVPNPTKQGIRNKIREYSQRLTPNDQVFYFFSMHGHYDEGSDRGYLVASDGKQDDPFFDTYLSYDDLRTDISPCKAKHILLALDACHSGSFGIRSKGGPDAPIYAKTEDCTTRINKAMQYQSRQYCTSGNKNSKAPAKSIFFEQILKALKNGGENGVLTFSDLEYWINKIDHQKPESGSFTKNEQAGDFIFVRKNACAIDNSRGITDEESRDIQDWKIAKSKKSKAGYLNYLASHPRGEFVDKAKDSLNFYEDINYSKALQNPSIVSWRSFIDSFPNGRHTFKAVGLLNNILSIDEAFDTSMVYIKGGTFTMGCNQKQCFEDEKPPHQVILKDFHMGKYEVTQVQWLKIMGENPSYFKGCNNCPVEQVSWHDVQIFISKLNKLTGKNYRLPTEAEWEFAARGNTNAVFANGDNLAKSEKINFNASASSQNSNSAGGEFRQKPISVGSFPPNKFGLYDMSGNVWEWCSDWKGLYTSQMTKNPQGGQSGISKIARGGSWLSAPEQITVSYRGANPPEVKLAMLGFRLVRDK